MGRPRKFLILLAAAAAAAAVLRHGRGARGRRVPGGILIGDTIAYDALSRLVLGSLFGRIATDVAAVAPDGARVLEVGCGPGRLSIRLVRQHGST
jgi:2-polyprenyl-3-methyl-5-hydroxy-6-metoxy-1,4-benzoquinol methylase